MSAGNGWGFPGGRRGVLRVVLALALVAALAPVLALLGVVRGLAFHSDREPPAATNATAMPNFYPNCLKCHGDPNLTLTLPSGESVSMYFEPETFNKSAHAGRVDCIDCHLRNAFYPHTPLKVNTRREFAVAEYEVCKRCHFENYTRTLDSMHFDAMAKGNAKAPVCTDCHGSHNVARIEGSHSKIAQTCSSCHASTYSKYARSVHGSALSIENPDVPVCTTCHGVHSIASADTASFRQGSVDVCIKCHGDKQLMDKYDISAAVTKTYLDDFHGKTVGFYQQQNSTVWPDVAVCTDCHGVHDITRVDDPESRVMKENLVATCRRCHADASASFPAAWLSHYEPSLSKHPLVYLIQQYYKFLIPVMVVGLAMNVGLDLWRLARNR